MKIIAMTMMIIIHTMIMIIIIYTMVIITKGMVVTLEIIMQMMIMMMMRSLTLMHFIPSISRAFSHWARNLSSESALGGEPTTKRRSVVWSKTSYILHSIRIYAVWHSLTQFILSSVQYKSVFLLHSSTILCCTVQNCTLHHIEEEWFCRRPGFDIPYFWLICIAIAFLL